MSGWQELRAERNRAIALRLNKALPPIFPRVVLARALARPFVPPTPRLAIESYWGAHPIRADRLARALAARSQAPSGWTWRLGDRRSGLPFTFRTPPAPYREAAHALGPGFCCVCGQPVYRLGWHVDLWEQRSQQERGLAQRLRGRLAVLECAKYPDPTPAAPPRSAAALRVLVGCGGMQKLTTASRCFGSGASTGTFHGRSCSIFGDCRTFRSLIAKSTLRNARWRRRAVEPYPLGRLNLRQAPDVKQVRGASRPIHRVIDRARRSSCRK